LGEDVIAAILKVTGLQFGYELAEQLLTKILPIIVPTPKVIVAGIDILKKQTIIDNARIRSMHELNVGKWGGTDADAWLGYCQFEFDQKDVKKLETLRWKAVRSLADSSFFQEEYMRRFCKKAN
jgi:hypothetical protein